MTIQTACSRLDRCQCADQAGFRRNFRTTDHLMTYRMIEQKSRGWGRPTYGLHRSSSRRLLLHYNMKQYGGVWLVCNPLFLRRHNVDGHVHHAHGGAARRRERRLRAFLRHEQPSLAMQTATVSHHSWRRAGRADASTQTVSYSAPAPVVEHAAPAPVFEYAAPAPVHADSWNLLCQSSRSRRFLRCRSSRNRRDSASPVCSRHPNFRELGSHSRSPCDLCGDCGHGRGGVTSPCRTCSSDS